MDEPAARWRYPTGTILLLIGSLMVVAWVLGFVFGDRWWWSQWFLWLTGLVLIPAGAVLWAGLLMLRRRWHAIALLLPLLGTVEYVFPRWNPGGEPQASGARILQWTAGPIGGATDAYGAFMAGVNPDVLIVEGARRAVSSDAFRAWSHDHAVLLKGPFLIASRLPVLRARTIAWAHDILVISLVTELPSGKPFHTLIVDLPSDPALSRASVVDQLQILLAKLEQEPDIIVGDFNLTQTSSLLLRIRGGFTPSWPRTGHGWGGTYPRAWPIYRLDHVLTQNADSAVTSINIIDPGCGRHRAQLIQIEEEAVSATGHGLPSSE